MQYTGTSEEFTARFNNNRCAHGNYRKKKTKKIWKSNKSHFKPISLMMFLAVKVTEK